MHADLFDELAEEFFGLFGTLACECVLDVVGKTGEFGRVGGCVPVCGELAGEVGLVGVEGFEAVTEATDALLADGGCELAVLEGFPA